LFANGVIKLVILLIIVGKKGNAERISKNKSKICCRICNNFGHVAKECDSKLNQQSISRDNVFYHYCKETGHLLENCKLRIASNNRRKINEQENANSQNRVCNRGLTHINISKNSIDKNMLEARPVTVNLNKHSAHCPSQSL